MKRKKKRITKLLRYQFSDMVLYNDTLTMSVFSLFFHKMLTLSTLVNNFKIFFPYFSQKTGLTFHANSRHSFEEWKKNNNTNLSSAELAQ